MNCLLYALFNCGLDWLSRDWFGNLGRRRRRRRGAVILVIISEMSRDMPAVARTRTPARTGGLEAGLRK